MTASNAAWRLGAGRVLNLDRPRLVGILNVTPDSFSDGGRYEDVASAVQAGVEMVEQGADVLDVGGESTRPGATRVDTREQIRRTQPVIKALAKEISVPISIDTTRAAVARAALEAGAAIVNDVSAGTDDADMFNLAAETGCGLILMHRKSAPEGDVYSHQHRAEPDYAGDVVKAVRERLAERLRSALSAGVRQEAIVVDPGLGFGKSVEQNFELVRRLSEFSDLGAPILIGASRKSFIGMVTSAKRPEDRLIGSVALAIEAVHRGARLLRVHDISAHREALAIWDAIDNI